MSVPYELIIVDNASSVETREYIESLCKDNPNCKSIFLSKNEGGEALNRGISKSAMSPYLHISANDLEYLPGWDRTLLNKFNIFPELGQLSLFVASADEVKRIGDGITRHGNTIYLASRNVPSPSIFSRKVWDRGARFKTRKVIGSTALRLTADGPFSDDVKRLGLWVAWNDRPVLINLGNSVKEWAKDVEYYLEVYRAKDIGEQAFRERLQKAGYGLVKDGGKHSIVKL